MKFINDINSPKIISFIKNNEIKILLNEVEKNINKLNSLTSLELKLEINFLRIRIKLVTEEDKELDKVLAN